MNCHSRGCPALDPGSRASHCAACHRTFSNLALFDRHQDWGQGWDSGVSCRPPEALGLVRAPNGTWWVPERLEGLTGRLEKMNAMRMAA
jgi:hypothetical protein